MKTPMHSLGSVMTRAIPIFLLTATVITAAEQAPPPRPIASLPWAVPDVQDVVVFAPSRPVRIRLAVSIEGKSIVETWREKLRLAFVHFDRDKDGSLNEKEVQNIFSDTGMSVMLQNGFYQATPQDRPTLEKLDGNKDGKVSLDEYLAYYKLSTQNLFRPQPPAAQNAFSAAATEALFKLMDVNEDGKLTRDEVRGIEKLLATRDADEDECLTQTELVPNFNNQQFVRPVQPVRGGPQPAPVISQDQPVLIHELNRSPDNLTRRIIKKYDTDGDFDLTREEVAFDEATFTRLDADGNGRLDGEELEAWCLGPPDLEVSLSFASTAADCVAKLVTNRADANNRGFIISQVEPGRLLIRLGRQPIEFLAHAAILNYRPPPLKGQYVYLFTQAAGKKDHVLEKDLNGPNAVQFQFLRTLFDAMDSNGDGKLTKDEFDAYFDLQDSFRNTALALTPTIQTPTLFELLDENRDGRLGVRELRTAWDRLIALEPSEGDVVTRAAIMPSVSLRLTRIMERFYINQPQYGVVNQNQVLVPQKGPQWFRRMDRNADGDVSRSEFLGTRAEFDAIDQDKDGLISLDEAEAYDKKMRVPETK